MFSKLPRDIQSLIFQFDPTYKEIFNKVVKQINSWGELILLRLYRHNPLEYTMLFIDITEGNYYKEYSNYV